MISMQFLVFEKSECASFLSFNLDIHISTEMSAPIQIVHCLTGVLIIDLNELTVKGFYNLG
jgi:hypothetical protein